VGGCFLSYQRQLGRHWQLGPNVPLGPPSVGMHCPLQFDSLVAATSAGVPFFLLKLSSLPSSWLQQPRHRRMKVSLEEMYKGSVRKLQMTRSVKCDKCSGSGSKSGRRYTCEVRPLHCPPPSSPCVTPAAAFLLSLAWDTWAEARVGKFGAPQAAAHAQNPPPVTCPPLHPHAPPPPAPQPACQVCHGSGVETKLRPLGPGMVQQIQQRCSRCGGGGYSCPPSDRCPQCDGKGLAPEKKVFEVRAW
jgi:hypothetical protein